MIVGFQSITCSRKHWTSLTNVLLTFLQDLRKRAQDLKGQLGLPAHHGGLSGQGGFMTSGGQYPADARNCLSLAEEFSLLPGFQVGSLSTADIINLLSSDQ